MFVVLAERGKSLTLTKLVFSMKYVLHFFFSTKGLILSVKNGGQELNVWVRGQ